MSRSLTITACLAIAVSAIAVEANSQTVREGVRRSGEAVAEGSRAVVRDSREAIGRAGRATRNVVGNNTDAALSHVDPQQRSELQPSSNANIGGNLNAGGQVGSSHIQADAGLDSEQGIGASGQIQQNLPGQTPTNMNNTNVQGQYQSGYRGLNDQGYADQGIGAYQSGQMTYGGRVYRLRHDRQGREYICVGGRPLYFDDQQNAQGQTHEAYKMNDDQIQGRQTNDLQDRGDEMNQVGSPFQSDSQNRVQGNTYLRQDGSAQLPTPPAPPTPLRTDLNSSAPTSPSLNADTDISAEQRTNVNESVDIDAGAESSANSNSSSESSTDADTESSKANDNVNTSESDTQSSSNQEDANE